MKPSGLVTLCFLLAPAAALAQDNRPDVGAIASSVNDLLTMVTFGLLAAPAPAAQVTPNGADYLARLPLEGFSSPANATLSATVRPGGDGTWQVAAMTLPPAGTIGPVTPDAAFGRIAYSLGGQTIQGKIDPRFIRPSPFAASLANVTLRSRQAEHRLERYRTSGTVAGNGSGQLDFVSHDDATNWRLTTRHPDGSSIEATVRTVSGRVSVHGLDRAKGTRLAAAARALIAAPESGRPPPAQRQQEITVVDALSGLLTRLEANQRLEDVRLNLGPGNTGGIGRINLDATIDAAGETIDARTGIAMDKLSSSLIPPDAAPYLPRHVAIMPIMTGVRPGPLMAFLRTALTQTPTQAELRARLMALISAPNARVGLKSLAFDCGPMQVTGWAWVTPRPAGQFGVDIHLAATGVDALMARAQTSPTLQQALPVMFLAKGIGRQEHGAIVWDLSVGDGLLTVNGFPFGQSPGFKR